MIGFLKGRLMAVESDAVLLEAGGVGYEVLCSGFSLGELQDFSGKDVALWIHTHVREDALQLFGFLSRAEKDLFLSLLKVNGVGPKLALGVLSGARASEIIDMIDSGNAKGLSGLPRVGKKTAEQIILTLQGKLVRVESPKNLRAENLKQVQTALVNLGFKPAKVDEYVSGLPLDIDVEEGVRKGLSTLSNAF